jgi:hypothetical protein
VGFTAVAVDSGAGVFMVEAPAAEASMAEAISQELAPVVACTEDMAAAEEWNPILRRHAVRQEGGDLPAVADGALDDPAPHEAWVRPPAPVLLTGNGTPLALVAVARSITAASWQPAFRPGAGDGMAADGAVVDGDGVAGLVGAAVGAGAPGGDAGAAAGDLVLAGVRLGARSGTGLPTGIAHGWPTTMRRLTT